MSIKEILDNSAQGEWFAKLGDATDITESVYYLDNDERPVWIADTACNEDTAYIVAYQPAHTELLEALLYAAEDALEIRLEDDGLDDLAKAVKAVNNYRRKEGLL